MSTRRATVIRTAGMVAAVGSTVLALTACVPFVNAGDRTTEDRDIDDASEIVFRTAGDLTVRLGDAPALTVTGGENVLQRLSTEVDGDRLVIEVGRGPLIVGEQDLDIDVTVTSLQSVVIEGSGDVSAEFGDASEVSLDIRGSGEIETDRVDAESVDASISGSGSIMVEGRTDRLAVNVSGSGDIDAGGLSAQSAQIVLSGSGGVSVDVSDSLDVTLSGSGTVRYSGRPEIRSTISGSGRIEPS
ncbi:head GIN domain-containing protein [Agromyces aurantiacus]|uniref:Head GIN domain-containing protein n=1 Tax=Agromyces aurantiacus TaxID=165814 RepID=A0ABV9R2Q2_9MICO|nr:head GIN domain-containing protein [Agromyces aurantiacus]MBM7503044.1 hypothetical protein [Agromyces aurantiacus]